MTAQCKKCGDSDATVGDAGLCYRCWSEEYPVSPAPDPLPDDFDPHCPECGHVRELKVSPLNAGHLMVICHECFRRMTARARREAFVSIADLEPPKSRLFLPEFTFAVPPSVILMMTDLHPGPAPDELTDGEG